MSRKFKTGIIIAFAAISFTSCNGQTANQSNEGKTKCGCKNNCLTLKKGEKMTTEKENHPNCGTNSSDTCCSSNFNDTTNLKSLVPSCNLSGKEMAERKKFLQATMGKKIAKVEELETGYDLIFHEPIEYSQELLEFINFERGCCANFSFALIFEPYNKATHLQMYGSKEIKEEIRNGFIELGFF